MNTLTKTISVGNMCFTRCQDLKRFKRDLWGIHMAMSLEAIFRCHGASIPYCEILAYTKSPIAISLFFYLSAILQINIGIILMQFLGFVGHYIGKIFQGSWSAPRYRIFLLSGKGFFMKKRIWIFIMNFINLGHTWHMEQLVSCVWLGWVGGWWVKLSYGWQHLDVH